MAEDTFQDKLKIQLDEPIGSLSMSPRNRDICLGARKGLFIIDLDNCYEPPLFLPHASAWEVADVQWSPHPSRAHWISSAAGGNALIWNLNLRGTRSPIEYTLSGHTRTVTDINFSVFELDSIATCSLDGQILTWDLRTQGRRPAGGFIACNIAATQVKYSRQNPSLIASAHDNLVNIWDMRKAAKPFLQITAHQQRCYGLDFDRKSADVFVTCSLDRTVKYWSISKPEQPIHTIQTTAPVWRARNLPFGSGVLALPQRSETALKMYSTQGQIIDTFEGHTDVPKEFVWRTRGGADPQSDDRQFQLVSWGRDRTLRTWPVSPETLTKLGHVQGAPIEVRMTRRNYQSVSFKTGLSPETEKSRESAANSPPDARSMTSGASNKRRKGGLSTSWKKSGESFGTSPHSDPLYRSSFSDRSNPTSWSNKAASASMAKAASRMTFMTRSKTQGGKIQKTMAWMESVNAQTDEISTSESVPPTTLNTTLPLQHRLRDEFTAVNKLFSGRLLFEKSNVAAGTCTLSCFAPHGADNGQCFIKVHLLFPSRYPNQSPAISVEKNAELVPKQRAFLLTGLRNLVSSHAMRGLPSLEPFCRFLLGDSVALDVFDDSSSEDEADIHRPSRVNVPLPRRCGAVFGPRDELICFFPVDALAIPTLQRKERKSSFSPDPQGAKKTILFDSFGALSKTIYGSDEEVDDESDEALRLPRLMSQLPGASRTRVAAIGPTGDTSTPTSTVVHIQRDLSQILQEHLDALGSISLKDDMGVLMDPIQRAFQDEPFLLQTLKLLEEISQIPTGLTLSFSRVLLRMAVDTLGTQRNIIPLVLLLSVIQLRILRERDLAIESKELSESKMNSGRNKPLLKISSPPIRPSLATLRGTRPSLVKFGEVIRKAERTATKRRVVQITMVEDKPMSLETFRFGLDIRTLMHFFGNLAFQWQLHGLRAEVLKLIDNATQGTEVLQEANGLCIRIDCKSCRNFSPPRCSSHLLGCTLCHKLAVGLTQCCTLCFHGGHQRCMQEWFTEEARCAALECSCLCSTASGFQGQFFEEKSVNRIDVG